MSKINQELKHRHGPTRLWLATIALALGVAFFSYYHNASSHLRLGAGPDYDSHNDVTRFIQQHRRLPVLPQDEQDLHFSVYGGTRALRPPLTYVLSAGVAKRTPSDRNERLRSYRTGSNVLGSLTVAIAFLAVATWTGRLLFGLFGALLVGLWPQFTFISTYNNDDIGAIFSASLLVYALLRLWRYGCTPVGGVLLGVAGGLVILSKPTAWLLLPFAAVFAIGLLFSRGVIPTLKTGIIALITAAVVGGWWLAFNAYHYGVDDIFLQKMTAQLADKHSRFDANQIFGYAAKGVNANYLIAGNYDGFMHKTWIALIGNLDWLRLRLGRIHYLWFSAMLLLAAMAPLLVSLVATTTKSIDHHNPKDSLGSGWWIVWAWFGTCVFQFAMYVYVNLYNDIQVQGKYLLPVLLPAVLLAISSVVVIAHGFSNLRQSDFVASRLAPLLSTTIVIPTLLITATTVLHYDALQRYVLPFYKPSFYRPPLNKLHMNTIREVALSPDLFANHNGIQSMRMKNGALHLTLKGTDPWLEFNRDICESNRSTGPVRGNIVARIKLSAQQPDKFVVYWDEGIGFDNLKGKNQVPYDATSNTLYLWMGMNHCHRLRLDPGHKDAEIILKSFELIDVTIDPEYDPPFSR